MATGWSRQEAVSEIRLRNRGDSTISSVAISHYINAKVIHMPISKCVGAAADAADERGRVASFATSAGICLTCKVRWADAYASRSPFGVKGFEATAVNPPAYTAVWKPIVARTVRWHGVIKPHT